MRKTFTTAVKLYHLLNVQELLSQFEQNNDPFLRLEFKKSEGTISPPMAHTVQGLDIAVQSLLKAGFPVIVDGEPRRSTQIMVQHNAAITASTHLWRIIIFNPNAAIK